MNKYCYKHLSQWERRKLQSLICNKPILKPIFGTTDYGWDIVNWKWLIDHIPVLSIMNILKIE